ncbi:hypothetical protein F4824DRAFT_502602 [Ustulina deusta]|nr:hypothetical protein F4824DRAFT_502602 [Ustulina deusta]
MMAEIITGDSQRETLITRLLQEHRGREVGMEICLGRDSNNFVYRALCNHVQPGCKEPRKQRPRTTTLQSSTDNIVVSISNPKDIFNEDLVIVKNWRQKYLRVVSHHLKVLGGFYKSAKKVFKLIQDYELPAWAIGYGGLASDDLGENIVIGANHDSLWRTLRHARGHVHSKDPKTARLFYKARAAIVDLLVDSASGRLPALLNFDLSRVASPAEGYFYSFRILGSLLVGHLGRVTSFFCTSACSGVWQNYPSYL